MGNTAAPRLNIIGAGHLGQTLARLWHSAAAFTIGNIVNRTPESSASAARFIGAGTAAESLNACAPAEFWLISVPDSAIAEVATALAAHLSANASSGDSRPCVFHCSGALSSEVLAALAECGCKVASAHPVHSFATPEQSVAQFAGSWVALEGPAAAALEPRFDAIGARCFHLQASDKSLYHCATAIACNYLSGLMDYSFSVFEQAGIPQEQAAQLLAPITAQTLDNNMQLGPARALTGPIARGDAATVRDHLRCLQARGLNPDLYRSLGQQTLQLAERNGKLSEEQVRALRETLS